ncbi:hypothetical protein [Vagococcus silagei]|uniref:Uncharacterized protein n=1 Tax=Vagococcus silagei TaxID=2508885 RepID=A0A4S3B5K9_9ENTE|nr:hypothetical protein [Vagococcus silagei]THB61828.1 hypothetical protein ESZ54_03385 [Vagococcus silagei]
MDDVLIKLYLLCLSPVILTTIAIVFGNWSLYAIGTPVVLFFVVKTFSGASLMWMILMVVALTPLFYYAYTNRYKLKFRNYPILKEYWQVNQDKMSRIKQTMKNMYQPLYNQSDSSGRKYLSSAFRIFGFVEDKEGTVYYQIYNKPSEKHFLAFLDSHIDLMNDIISDDPDKIKETRIVLKDQITLLVQDYQGK